MLNPTDTSPTWQEKESVKEEKEEIDDDFEEKQGWPVDHETTCGLCGHSFQTICPNGLYYEDIYCPDGCQFQEEEVEEIDRKRWRKWIIKHHLS